MLTRRGWFQRLLGLCGGAVVSGSGAAHGAGDRVRWVYVPAADVRPDRRPPSRGIAGYDFRGAGRRAWTEHLPVSAPGGLQPSFDRLALALEARLRDGRP